MPSADDQQTTTGPIIHVGYHKAGSTLLQHAIFPKLEASYYHVGISEKDYISTAVNYDASRIRSTFPVGREGSAPLILSNECFSGDPFSIRGKDNALVIAERLRQTYPDARILFIIREQLDYIVSVYCYYVAISGATVSSISSWLKRTLKGFAFLEKLQYDILITLYQRLFSRDQVHVIPYEYLKESPERFSDALLTVSGCRPKAGQSIDLRKRHNPGIRHANTVFASRLVNLLFLPGAQIYRLHKDQRTLLLMRGWGKLKRQVINPTLTKFIPPGAEVSVPGWFMEQYGDVISASNRRIEEVTGLKLAPLGYNLT